ncbi:MAG: outer membrane protein assembly factor BamA [Maritimibacter sp.]
MMYGEHRSKARKRHSANLLKPAATAILLGVSGACALQVPAAYAQSYTFSSVQIVGTERVDAKTILTYLGISKGKTIGAGELNDAYQRVSDSGLFEKVELQPRGRTLVVRVQEFPIVSRINIEGNRRLKDEELLLAITSKPRYVFSAATAERDADAIADAYAAKGRLAATVTPRIIRRGQGRVDLVFEVEEGRVSEVERLSFTGNRNFSDSRLRRVLTTKQAGLLRAIIKADTYDAGRLDFDQQVLTDFYTSRGYVDFQINAVISEVAGTRDGYQVTFDIQEGQQFSLGKITTVSEIEGLSAADFEAVERLREGSTYDPSEIELVIARMERVAIEQGLSFVNIEPRVTRNDRDGTLDLEFAIVRGPRVIVERIDIEGNATTLDRVVRSQFRTVEGDPFNPREIRNAAERIRALGYFANVDIQAREGSASDRVIVDVNVEEQGTGSLAFGAAWSTATGFGVNASFSETNFLGRGQYVNIEFTGGLEDKNYVFDFAEPNALGRDLRLGFSAYYKTSSAGDTFFYDTQKFKVTPTISFPTGKNTRLGLRAGISGTNMYYADTDDDGVPDPIAGNSAVIDAEVARGWTYGGEVGATYTFDSNISGLDPRTRFRAVLSGDIMGIGSDNTYLKATVDAQAQTKVMNDQVTLRANFEGGAIYSFGAGTRTVDRFIMGPHIVRGFDYNGFGPRDTGATNNNGLGGNYYAAARVEAQFPLGLPEEYGISGGVFADVGTVWGLDNTLGGAIDDNAYLRASVGASLFWTTPVGPLRFNYSIPLRKQTYDLENRFEVTFQTSF